MRVRTRSTVAIAGVAALALGLAACGGSDDPTAADASGAVIINGGEPENPLIPSNTNETGGGNVIDNLFTGLIEYNSETADPELAMAESIEPNDDKTVWTVKIKPNWKFHDGTDVTTKSFVDAWNYASYGPNAQLNSYFWGPDGLGIKGFAEVQGEDANGDDAVTEDEAPVKEMTGLKVVDDTTFEVTLENPNGLFEIVVGYSAFAPLPESFFDDPAAFGENPIGNGPFKFVSWDKKQQIKMAAYTEYTGDDVPQVKDVTWKIYQDLDAAYADLLAGNLDVLDSIPVSALAGDQYKADLGDRWVNEANGVIQTMTFPLYVKEFENVDLRRAVSMAVDREQITETIFNKTRKPANGFVSPVVNGYVADACGDNCVYNADEAKKALAASGFSGALTIAYNADGGHKEWTEATCNSIKNTLGLECNAIPFVDFKTFRKAINNDEMTGIFRTGWQMDYPSIENFLAPIYATTAGSNDGGYSSPEFDALLKSAKGKIGDEANKDYQAAEQILSKDIPAVPLWYGATTGGWSEAVTGVEFTPFSRVNLTSIKKASS